MNTADGRHRPSVLWAYAAIDGLSVKTDEAKLLGVLKMDNDCENKVLLFLRYYKTDLQLTFFFDSGNGSRRRLVTTTRLHEDHIQEEYATLLGLHAFSGSDSFASQEWENWLFEAPWININNTVGRFLQLAQNAIWHDLIKIINKPLEKVHDF